MKDSSLPFFYIGLQVSDNLNIRSRQVYNVIEFISEISGFADIFFVLFGFFLGHFYTPLSQTADLYQKTAQLQARDPLPVHGSKIY